MANQVVRFSSTEFRVYRDGKYTGEHYKTRAEAVAAAESSTPAGGQRPVQAPAAPSRPAPAVQPAHRPEPAAQPDAWFVVTNQYEMKGGGFVYAGPTPQEESYTNPVNVLVLTVVDGPMGQKEALRRAEELSAAAWQKQAEKAVSYEEYKQGQTMPSAARNERKAMHMANYQTGVNNGFLLEKYLAVPYAALREELAYASDPGYIQEVAERYLAYRNAAMQASKGTYSRQPTYTPVRTGPSKYAALAKPHGNQHQPVDVLIPLARGEEDIFNRVDYYSTYSERVGKSRKRSWGDYVWWTTGENNGAFLRDVPEFHDWWAAHHVRKNPNTMIPLPYPRADYEWSRARPLASWTSDPLYSYQQYARSNGRARSNGKLAPSPTIGIAKPYRMPDNAGPYLPRIFPYGPYGRPATYEVGKDNPAGEITDPREIEANVQAFTAAFVKMKPRLISILDRNVEFSDQDKEDVVSRTYQYLLRAVREGHSRPGPALMVLALKQRAIDTLRERKHAASPRHQVWDKAHLSGEDISTAELASLGYGQGPTSPEDVVFLRQVTARLPAETREAQKYHISDGDLIALNAQGMNMSDIADMLLEKDSEYVRLKAAAARDDKAAAKVEELLRRVGDTLIKRASRARQKLGEWAGPHRNPRALPNYRGYQPGEREHLPASAFLKPETRSWPVSDKDHAFIALQYMTRGFGNRKEYPMLIQRLAQIWPPSGHPDIWSWYEAHRAQMEQMAGRHMPKIGRENGMTIRRGKPGQKKPYFYMTSRELKEAIASGDAGAQGEADRRGWVGGEPTYTIGGRK